MAEEHVVVTGGVDTHKDTHVGAVIDGVGRLLGSASFDASRSGYVKLVEWMVSFGNLGRVGVEGTGSYGAGLAKHLTASGIEVIEVNRPNRQMRRMRGKNDTVDAEAAARAALSGQATAVPKAHNGLIEAIRVLRVAFRSARAARTTAALQIRDLIVSAPDELRESLESLSIQRQVAVAGRFRPGPITDPSQATRAALGSLARRYESLTAEVSALRIQLDELTLQANPALRAAKGVGTDVASILLIAAGDNPERLHSQAAFAAMCGVSPIEASSGRTSRHRLNRGGNRQANHALWRIAMVRLATDADTKTYAERRTAEGKTRREISRCLKRYIAREIFRLLTQDCPVPDTTDLRPTRQAAGITLQIAAEHFNTWPARISELERGRRRDDDLETRYRTWLHDQKAA